MMMIQLLSSQQGISKHFVFATAFFYLYFLATAIFSDSAGLFMLCELVIVVELFDSVIEFMCFVVFFQSWSETVSIDVVECDLLILF